MSAGAAAKAKREQPRCGVCGRSFAARDLFPVDAVRHQIADDLARLNPDWRQTGYICRDDLATARRAHVEQMLLKERGELTDLEQTVIDSVARHETLATNVEADIRDRLTFGEALADRVAKFGGSWTFIIIFAVIIAIWMTINVLPLVGKAPFDPYPFILLNLALSCLAAIQAPLIMMSQHRQEAKDRLRSENDYRINLKAELEIRHLHEKLDHLLVRQWQRLAEIQQIQLEIMEDLDRRAKTT
ncbi:MAG: DUF1003 domain-containing protein [Alphaproteobacteria bacterium]